MKRKIQNPLREYICFLCKLGTGFAIKNNVVFCERCYEKLKKPKYKKKILRG